MKKRFHHIIIYPVSVFAGLLMSFQVLFMVMPCACISADGIVTVLFNTENTVRGAEIRLGEIATLKGDNRRLIQRLEKVCVGRSPIPGRSTQINERQIRLRIRQAGIKSACVKIVFPSRVKVERECVRIPRAKLREIVRAFVLRKVPWGASHTRIKKIEVKNDVILPRGYITYNVLLPEHRYPVGKVPVQIQYNVDGKLARTVWVTADITVMMKVVVSKRPIRRAHFITGDDVAVRERSLRSVPVNVITELKDVIGKRAKRKIGPMVVMSRDLIEQPPLVKRGDMVRIVAESGCLRVTALGEIMSRGYEGGRVCVMNLDSRKKIFARVVDSSTVRVNF